MPRFGVMLVNLAHGLNLQRKLLAGISIFYVRIGYRTSEHRIALLPVAQRDKQWLCSVVALYLSTMGLHNSQIAGNYKITEW